MNPSKWPKTVNEAVTILVSKLGRDQKAELRGMTRDDLIEGSHDLRIHIRNQFGIPQNRPLLEDTGKKLDPEGAIMVIVEALWRRLQKVQ